MELMLAKLRGEETRRETVLKSRLIVRESCGGSVHKPPP